jgi:hypothetical protein
MKVMIEDVVMQFKHDIRRCLSAEFIVTVCQTLGLRLARSATGARRDDPGISAPDLAGQHSLF